MRIDKEHKRYGQRRPRKRSNSTRPRRAAQESEKRKFRTRSRPRRVGRSGKKSEKSKLTGARFRRRRARPQAKRPKHVRSPRVKPVNRQRQRKAINRLLEDLYRSRRYVSDILQSRGFSDQEIGQVKQYYLPAFLDSLLEEVKAFWRRTLSPQEYDMLRTKYALNGKPPPRNESLARQYGLSGKTIPNVRRRALHRLRSDSLITHFEMLVAHSAREVLRKDNL